MLHNKLFSSDKADMTAKDYVAKSSKSITNIEYDYAILYANFALHLDPKSELAYYNRGRALIQKNRAEEALADFDEVIKLNPKNSSAWLARASVQPNKADALYDFLKVLELDPKNAIARSKLYELEHNLSRDQANLLGLSKAASKEKQVYILQVFLENPLFRVMKSHETVIIKRLADLINAEHSVSGKAVFYKAALAKNSVFSQLQPEVNNKAVDEGKDMFFSNDCL